MLQANEAADENILVTGDSWTLQVKPVKSVHYVSDVDPYPDSFGSVDPEPEVKNELRGKSRV